MHSPGKVYYVSEHASEVLLHGIIGLVDIENILTKNKAIAIRFPYHFDFSFKAKIARLGYLVNKSFAIAPGSVVLFLHPVNARMNKLLLRILRLRRSIRIVCLVADIRGLKEGDVDFLKKEKIFFRKHRYFILHNLNMDAWLRSFHPSAICTFLECFDFLTDNNHHLRSKSNTIVFAGNLQKSGFLEQLHLWLEKNPSLFINLYGPHVTDGMLIDKRVSYKGVHPPYSLPDLVEGSFGLIWDGDGVEQPSGSLGHYMQFISHHKLSLYIVSNLPVIVHEKAGSANLVKKFNFGFTVSSLFEIESKISKLSETDYQQMVHNTHDLAREITAGNGLQKALNELLNK
jgi:hypothetical protein